MNFDQFDGRLMWNRGRTFAYWEDNYEMLRVNNAFLDCVIYDLAAVFFVAAVVPAWLLTDLLNSKNPTAVKLESLLG